MHPSDLDRIEQALGIELPASYRAVLEHYPFGPYSCGEDSLVDDAEDLIRANRRPHDILRGEPPTRGYLWIGCDGGESSYYLDLQAASSPVYEYDLEMDELTVLASDIDDFVSKCKQIDQEVAEDEQRAAQKRWWPFWR